MKNSLSLENINKAVEDSARFLELNSIGKQEILRWSLFMEHVLLLYRDNGSNTFSVACKRRWGQVTVRLFIDGNIQHPLEGKEDIIIKNVLSGFDCAPVWSRKRKYNVITLTENPVLPGIWSLKFILPYLKKARKSFAAALIYQILMVAVNIIIPLLTSMIVIAYTDSEIHRILVIAAVLLLAGVVSYFFEYRSRHYFVKVYSSLLNELEIDLSRKFFNLSDQCVNEYGSGIFIQRMVDDTEMVADGFNNIAEIVFRLVQTIGVIVAVGTISVPVCLFFIFTMVLTLIIEMKRIRKKGQDDRAFRKNRERYTGFISEMIRGSRDIKLHNSVNAFIEKMLGAIHSANEGRYSMEEASSSRIFVRKGVKEICDFVLYAGMALMIASGSIIPSLALVLFNYNIAISDFGYCFGNFLDYVNSIMVSSERIFHLIYGNDFTEEKFGLEHPETFAGNITMRNLFFSYENGENRVMVLNGINVDIAQGEKVAIVGRSGCGKTTILNLLTGLYRPLRGQMMIDGRDYRSLSADYIRGNIAVVSQFPYIFNMTVRENLYLSGKESSDAEMENACRAAGIYEDIMNMPQKFDTLLGEGGVYLSGGQRQRLAIARCLMRKSRMILLDEATSAIDNVTQKGVIDNIGTIFSDCTVITAAHRLSTIINSNRILFMSNGKITAEGTHEQLLAECPEYAQLYCSEYNYNS